jgi:hypothetical protein
MFFRGFATKLLFGGGPLNPGNEGDAARPADRSADTVDDHVEGRPLDISGILKDGFNKKYTFVKGIQNGRYRINSQTHLSMRLGFARNTQR